MEKIINILKENQATISFNSLNIICDSYFIYKDKKDAIIRSFKLNGLIDDKKTSYMPECLQLEFLKRVKNKDNIAIEVLVKTNYNLILYVIKNYYIFNFDKEDLIEYGMLGLLHAIYHFDISKDTSFSTYATHCIKGILKNSILHSFNPLKIGRNTFMITSKIKKIEEFLMKEKENEVITDEEILDELKKEIIDIKITLSDIKKLRQYQIELISTDTIIYNDNGRQIETLLDTIPSLDNVEEDCLDNIINSMIKDILNGKIDSNLSERELLIIRYLYGINEEKKYTSDEIGKILNISGARVRDIEKIALRKLKKLPILSDLEKKYRVK